MAFFELRTARDMFEKAEREYERFSQCCDIDNLFNFFVSAYHIKDYINKTMAVPEEILNDFMRDQIMQDCCDVCNKGKHLILDRKRPDPATYVLSGCIGGAPIGELPVNGGEKWILSTGGREVDVELLAKQVLEKWKLFFEIHGL